MQEMMLAGRYKNVLGPPISSAWRLAVKLTFNKGLTNTYLLKGTAFMCDVRVYVNDTVLISEKAGTSSLGGSPLDTTLTTGITSVTIWTKPAVGGNSYHPNYGLEVMCNLMPTGCYVLSATGLEASECRRLWISYANQLLNVPNQISPLIWHLRFYGASAFNNGGIVNWDTSNLKSMSNMFYGANKLNQDISGWNTSNVTNMAGMFYSNFVFNNTIKDWDVSKVTTIDNMFYACNVFNQDLSSMIFKSNTSRLNYDVQANMWNTAYRPQFTG